jgi:hypothetical protein
MNTSQLLLGLACLVLGACLQTSDDASMPNLSSSTYDGHSRLMLEAVSEDAIRISLNGLEAHGPRVVELWLRVTNATALRQSNPGAALVRAGKDLIVQHKRDDSFRVVMMSGENTNKIGAGELATLEFERAGEGPMRIEILTDRPMFAPQEAQQGLTVGDPIEL